MKAGAAGCALMPEVCFEVCFVVFRIVQCQVDKKDSFVAWESTLSKLRISLKMSLSLGY